MCLVKDRDSIITDIEELNTYMDFSIKVNTEPSNLGWNP